MAPYTIKRKHHKTLSAIFASPTSGNIKRTEAESMLVHIGATIKEREGSRVAIFLNGNITMQHRPHPRPTMDKGAVADLRDFLINCRVTP